MKPTVVAGCGHAACAVLQGLRKPSREAYEAALASLRVPAARVVFVDDRQANVDGASAAGMRALRFTGSAALEEALRAQGLCFAHGVPDGAQTQGAG